MSCVNEKVVLIVKATLKCNMSCTYCYEKGLHLNKIGDMSEETVDNILRVFGKDKIREWIWHGGEPLLRGPKWLSKETQKIKDFDNSIDISMQTNLTLVNDEIIEYFKKYNINPGTSFDGLNNSNTRKNTGMFMKSLNKIRSKNIINGAIMVVTDDNIDKLIDEYEYGKALNLSYTMNIIFGTSDNEDANSINYSKTVNGINKFFDYWIYDQSNPTRSSILEGYLNMIYGDGRKVCNNVDCCGKWFGIDPTGKIYPCGRNWTEEYCFGNVKDFKSAKEIYENPKFINYQNKTRKILDDCKGCILYNHCKGQCFAGELLSPNGTERKINCEVTKGIVSHIFNIVKNVNISRDYEKYNPIFIKKLLEYQHRNMDLIKELEELEEHRKTL